ncbi:carboxymuconolactone decarboxylase family protein [Mesorhizobium kowhaii]|uniref:carboxymuconolactone decarboxylase family protein n=1 Tax=Mesorhizobium kowhaii TaxID=1300272 RepID=UPI0035E615E6
MKTLKPQTDETAPEGSKENLRAIRERFGFVPNLMATFANSPAMLNGYLALDTAWEKSSFSAQEREMILLTASVANRCLYCVAVHATALKALHLEAAAIDAIRNRSLLADPKQDALVTVTRELASDHGYVSEAAKKAFFDAGYDIVALMEILAGIALKTMSNYLDHLNPISIDPAFEAETQQVTLPYHWR